MPQRPQLNTNLWRDIAEKEKKFNRYDDWRKVIKSGDMDDEDELRSKTYLRQDSH